MTGTGTGTDRVRRGDGHEDGPALRVVGVHKAYGRRRVLRGVDLELPPGRLAGVVGENGSGKSTLLRILAGHLAPDRGVVDPAGRIGYCPQEAVLNPQLTVEQHIRLFQVAYEIDRPDRTHHLMEQLDLLGHRRDRTERLSGGTRQKLNLVLALMHDPPLLLLDEPYQGFDWETYLCFWQLAGDLRARGRSLLVVSHMAHETDRFDLLWRFQNGRLENAERGWTAVPATRSGG